MRRVSLVALTLAGAGTLQGAIHGAAAQDAPVVAESTLTATISQSIEADSNYNLDAGLARHHLSSATPASASA